MGMDNVQHSYHRQHGKDTGGNIDEVSKAYFLFSYCFVGTFKPQVVLLQGLRQ